MATITGQRTLDDQRGITVLWETLTAADEGNAQALGTHRHKSVQIIGTFDTTTVTIEGSNDGGTTWTTLTDDGSTALSFTAAALANVFENTNLIRAATSGGASTDIDVHLYAIRET